MLVLIFIGITVSNDYLICNYRQFLAVAKGKRYDVIGSMVQKVQTVGDNDNLFQSKRQTRESAPSIP